MEGVRARDADSHAAQSWGVATTAPRTASRAGNGVARGDRAGRARGRARIARGRVARSRGDCRHRGQTLALEDDPPADDRGEYLRVLDLRGGDREQVAIDDDEVREFARGDRALAALLP